MYSWLQASFDQLCQRASQNRLHHALLLKGFKGIGKTKFAEQLGRFLLCANKQTVSEQGYAACGQCQSCLLLGAGNQCWLFMTRTP